MLVHPRMNEFMLIKNFDTWAVFSSFGHKNFILGEDCSARDRAHINLEIVNILTWSLVHYCVQKEINQLKYRNLFRSDQSTKDWCLVLYRLGQCKLIMHLFCEFPQNIIFLNSFMQIMNFFFSNRLNLIVKIRRDKSLC